MTYLPLPRPNGDGPHLRVLHGLLRYVREAAESRTPLPGEFELTARLECTRQQLRNAMTTLEAQGIVRRRQGSVTTVDPIALRLSVRLEEQFEHAELLDRLGYQAEVETLSSTLTVLGADAGAVMELAADMPAFAIRKRWRADGAVAMIADDLLPLPDRVEPPAPTESVFTAAARAWGEPVIWEVSTPGVTTLPPELAELFERPAGTAVMTFEIVGIGASGRRLMHSMEYHDPDIVAYSLVRTVRPPWGGA
ncbi:GntR family transcriptional regulator [Microbacterium sp. cx-55]|uniref:GntR family transcriptional regulator n=1 Tax=unclassified Microbacterium TaxID=2609290 RepID=UPI001CBF77BD|nr:MULTISPECIES: GntR family transcriptional regulator [unclassified Microbacterium]MBZ4487461.1 GntR family transcriptional regulator [Microbacterium sp. cx-55]MCC4908408.1 GntR family transcriptional regulator [Microbacterium sp. cx-59]UGB35481.1 GntR family transcriptional regulator [Microbacterium sp. cx-55]